MTQTFTPVETISFSLKRSSERGWASAYRLEVREQDNREQSHSVRHQSVALARPSFPILL